MRIFFTIFFVAFCVNASSNDEVPELVIQKIQQGVYLYKSHFRTNDYGVVSANGLVVVANGKAFLIDTPWSEEDTIKLANWVEQNGYELVGSISTHSHEDRTAGISWLNSNSVKTVASVLTNQLLRSKEQALAKIEFKGTEFSLEGGSIQAFYPGEGHTQDNIVIWLPESKLLFGGCFIRSLGSTGLGYVGEAYIDKWASSVDKVISRYPDVKVVIPGHGGVGDIKLLHKTKDLADKAYIKSIKENSGKP